MIDPAIRRAHNEHVVYFLLTSYFHLRSSDIDRCTLAAHFARLPIAGEADVNDRLRAANDASASALTSHAAVSPILKDVVQALRVASSRIAGLRGNAQPAKSWNVVERSHGGHVRRRRLVRRMTESEAAEWGARKGMRLERADDSHR